MGDGADETRGSGEAERPMVLDCAPAAKGTGWPLKIVLPLFVIILLAQMVFLPCLCYRGKTKGDLALALDGLFVIRFCIAHWRRESGRDWIIYLVILATSVVWIEWLVEEVF